MGLELPSSSQKRGEDQHSNNHRLLNLNNMTGLAVKAVKIRDEEDTYKVFVDKENRRSETCSSPLKKPRSLKTDAWEWEEVEIDIGWGKLRGKARGSGSRRVLGLHGWLDNANTFDLIAPMLPSDVHFLSLDFPGHGNSDHFPPGFIYDPKTYMGSVKKAMKAFGWERFILLGHSMGAVVGILYTAVFPEDVEAFLSVDIIKPFSTPVDKYNVLLRKYFTQYFDNEVMSKQPPLIYEEEELVKKTIEGSKSLDERGARIILSRGAEKSEDGKGLFLKRDLRAKPYFIGFMTFEAWVELAKSMKCPQLFIKATEGHYYESKERNDIMLSAFREDSELFSYIEMKGKHHVHLTHPEVVGEYIVSFLDECQALRLKGADSVVRA